jgi:hypothetical protein
VFSSSRRARLASSAAVVCALRSALRQNASALSRAQRRGRHGTHDCQLCVLAPQSDSGACACAEPPVASGVLAEVRRLARVAGGSRLCELVGAVCEQHLKLLPAVRHLPLARARLRHHDGGQRRRSCVQDSQKNATPRRSVGQRCAGLSESTQSCLAHLWCPRTPPRLQPAAQPRAAAGARQCMRVRREARTCSAGSTHLTPRLDPQVWRPPCGTRRGTRVLHGGCAALARACSRRFAAVLRAALAHCGVLQSHFWL